MVKDFHFRSLHIKVEPLALHYGMPDDLNRIVVSVKGTNVASTVATIEKTWKSVAPQRPFLYYFLDQQFNQQYQSEQHFGYLFPLFSFLAIFIACLGLFGLATFTAKQRTKQIGIRKVLGASVENIVVLIADDFMRLVVIAIVMAIPLRLLVMNRWLNDLAYRVAISPVIFVAPAAIALLIALTAISRRSVKAALANPVRAVESE